MELGCKYTDQSSRIFLHSLTSGRTIANCFSYVLDIVKGLSAKLQKRADIVMAAIRYAFGLEKVGVQTTNRTLSSKDIMSRVYGVKSQGGNFHLKVGGAKSSSNAGDPMLGVAVGGGSRIVFTTTSL